MSGDAATQQGTLVADGEELEQAVYRIALALAAEHDLDALMQRLTDEVTALCHAEMGAFFYTPEEAAESLRRYTLSGVPKETFALLDMPSATAIFGPTFRGEAVLRLDDVTADPRYGKSPPHFGLPERHPPVRSYLAVPVRSRGGEVMGGLFLGHARPGAFTERHERLLVTVAGQAGIALENAQLLHEARRSQAELAMQVRRFALGAEIGAAFAAGHALQPILTRCAESIVRNLDTAFARIWTLNAAEHVLELQASAGLDTHLDGREARLPVGAGEIGLIAQDRAPRLTNDLRRDQQAGDLAWAEGEGLVSFAGYPILVADELIGVVATFGRGPLPPDTLDGLRSITGVMGVGIQQWRAQAERERLIATLQRKNRELDQFAYVTSHDLKAPLRGIASLAEWLEEDVGPALPPEASHHLRLLRDRVRRLEALIDGILRFSRAGQADEPTELIDTHALVVEVITLLAPPSVAEIRIGPGMPSVLAERALLQQVFLNLIGNALKHAGRDDVHIEIGCQDAGLCWQFSVTDDGPGIAGQFHQRIWGMFQTLAASGKAAGSGIGLSIVKKVVDSRGGRVWVESTPPNGATFHFLWRKSPH